MAIKQLMADTAQLVDFFNTLTDVDIEMITFIDLALDQDKRPGTEGFIKPTLSWYDPDHTGYHEVGSIEKDLH